MTVLGKRAILVLTSLFFGSLAASASGSTVVGTRHDLSIGGPGLPGVTASTDQEQVCIFCHVPHHSNEVLPLWSRQLGGNYQPYDSPTLKAKPGQPSGGSRLCLSCHDGTIALGTLSGNGEASTLGALPSSYRSNLDTQLVDDHPISFDYSSAALGNEMHDPPLNTNIRFEDGRLECTSCHDPHKDLYGNFLVMENTGSALCLACHDKTDWSISSHEGASVMCEDCHVSHQAGLWVRLLKGSNEEATCLESCHNGAAGNGADVTTSFNRTYSHPLGATVAEHSPNEDPLAITYHVECGDCHNPHRANGSGETPPEVTGRLVGVSGVNKDGVAQKSALYQYEICFKCHADNPVIGAQVPRQISNEGNTRQAFSPLNDSYHPVIEKTTRIIVAPSLVDTYMTSSGTIRTFEIGNKMIYCSDCHQTHGTSNPILLDANYQQVPTGDYDPSYYELCFRCHDPNVLFDPDQSEFPHRSHVKPDPNDAVEQLHVGKEAPCSVCHDPHGVATSLHLINFDIRFVTGSYGARSCTVSCHSDPDTGRSY